MECSINLSTLQIFVDLFRQRVNVVLCVNLKNLIIAAIKFADVLGWGGGWDKGKEEVLKEYSLHRNQCSFSM